MNAPLLFTVTEAAKKLGISRRMLDTHVKEGEITYVLIGKRKKMFALSDLENFIETRRQVRLPSEELSVLPLRFPAQRSSVSRKHSNSVQDDRETDSGNTTSGSHPR